MNYIEKVKEFHETFNHPVVDKPCIPDAKRSQLRVDLIQEELDELKEAIKNNDLVEVADALADLQYVLSGAILEFGMGDKFNELFDEVHRSNMSKACETREEALATINDYDVLRNTPSYLEEVNGKFSYLEEVNGKFFVFRCADGKLLKSINYSPANIKKILK